MKLSILLLLCLLPVFCTFSQSKPKANYPYLLYLPKDYASTTKNYPVIIYLHGSSHRGTDLNKLKSYGLPYVIDKGREFEFIIVSPQCPNGKLWYTDNWFEPLYAELKTKYRIDPSRVYLTGISMGGGGVFEVAKDHPDTFAALVPLCAWQSNTSRICRLKNTPIWTFHGTADEVVPISETDEKVRTLQKCNATITYTQLENDGHGIQWLYEKQDKYDIYQWMLKYKK
ncbi:alpha/beta hydrolase-fold protein [Runella sp.]|uniref:carboxylesterase family protein n=1 Tax=Runella sp. TaxID=1960881 RepID=UPI003D144304